MLDLWIQTSDAKELFNLCVHADVGDDTLAADIIHDVY